MTHWEKKIRETDHSAKAALIFLFQLEWKENHTQLHIYIVVKLPQWHKGQGYEHNIAHKYFTMTRNKKPPERVAQGNMEARGQNDIIMVHYRLNLV